MNKKINSTKKPYDFNIDNFNGPLDLLLHLSKTHEIEIVDISLNQLINQYISYIKTIDEQGIDIASEYLEMAAELILLKSKSILPNQNDDDAFFDELDELELDRETLINKLLEYKRYKEISTSFFILNQNRGAFITKTPENLNEYRQKSFEHNFTIDDFIFATQKAIAYEISQHKNEKIMSTPELNMEVYLIEFKTLKNKFNFNQRIKILNIHNIISLFLAILEGLKLQYISFEIVAQELIIYPQNKEIYE